GRVGGAHHERLDGTGYHRGARAADLTPVTRILAAAELYQTKLEPRPHRAALSPASAKAEVERAVRAGTIDAAAASAVLSAAGHGVTPTRRTMTAGLTAREVDVLRLVAAGQSSKQIATTLGISARTAENHTQNAYTKIGVTTRAA